MSSICFYVSLKCNSIEKTPDKCYDNSNLEKKHLKGRGQKQERLAFCLGGMANYKALWLCGFNKASQRAWSRVRFGVRRMWVVSFSVHKQAVSVHPCMPEYTHGRIVAATSTNKLLCDSLAPLTLLKQTRALCPFFRAPSSPLCICYKNGAPDYFQTPSKRDLFALWVLYFSVTRESTSSLDYNVV